MPRTVKDTTPPLAAELNEVITRENAEVFAMLSELGRRLYFPKGILAQAAEAKEKATRFDATIGIAREKGKAMFLPSVMQYFPALAPGETLTYAPATGQPALRKQWRELLLTKNPSLAGKSFSTPIVTSGVTHALSLAGDLFLDKRDTLLLPDKYWENYDLLFSVRFQARIATYSFFNRAGGFNVQALARALARRPAGAKTVLILNFPNNPTGYSIRKEEADAVVATLVAAAEGGQRLVVITDDAYFGLFYEEAALHESLFARLAGAHPRLLAVKVDGPTKEQFVWGFRTGMLTFSAVAANDPAALYGALEKKVAGAIRSAISNCSQPAQTVLSKAIASQAMPQEQAEKRAILEARARRTQEILASREFADVWTPYPFNAGYFMCLRMKKVGAEAFRKHLLEAHGIGVIAEGETDIRVAFSAVEEDDLPELFATMARAAREMGEGTES